MSRSFLLSTLFVLGLAFARPMSDLPAVRAQLNSTSPNSHGISPVSFADDGTYYTVIQAGLISFRASIDTGSSDFWLVSTGCTSQSCLTVPKYPLTYASPTFVPVNNNDTAFNISYADGTVASGFVAKESVEVSNVTALNQTFGVVTHSNVTLIDDVSGVLGLGFPRNSRIYADAPNASPFLATLVEQGILDYPIFSLYLTRNSTGTLALGAVDATVVRNASNIVWNEVVPFSPLGTTNTSGYMFWAIQMSSFAINTTVLTPIPTYPGPTWNSSIALLDTGTPGLYGPYQDVKRLYALFPESRLVDESGQWAIPCASSATMTFRFGDGTAFILQPTDYLIGPTEGNPDLCLSWPKASPPSPDGLDWQLGTPFLRTVYSIWSYGIDDVQPPMIGLYPLTNASEPVESSDQVSSFFSSQSAFVPTTLPNYLLPTPSYTTPPYAFNTSVPAWLGEIVDSELATSTYSPIPLSSMSGGTGLPVVSDQYTLVATDARGNLVTSTYHLTQTSVVLGEPPGWSGATTLRTPVVALGMTLLVAFCAGVWIL